jgi:hypothetical protein
MKGSKYTSRKIKITSTGLFFNDRSIEKKVGRLGSENSFFRPFNSVFEREIHVIGKQKRNFN